jgi:DNA-binding MarR family transcriptional regulator
MNAVFFGLKRGHHAVLRLVRGPLAEMGLTAARFDLLFAMKTHEDRRILQGKLQKKLGVSRTTVSRMLASLEKLGFVKRTVFARDRRKKLVELTTRGRWTIAFAYRQTTKSGWAELALYSALGASGRCDWSDESAKAVAADLERKLHDIRRAFGDRADLEYEPHPDDYDPDHPSAWYDDYLDFEEDCGAPTGG